MITALDFKEGVHLNFNTMHLALTTTEIVSFGTSPVIDILYKCGTLPLQTPVLVTWGSILHLSASNTISRDSWVLMTIESVVFLACIRTFYQINGVALYVHHQPYPLNLLETSPLYSSYVMPEATLDHPTVPEMSHSMSEVTDLTKLVRFVENGIAHFIKL